MAEEGENSLTEAEAKLYDRQLRLWGVQSQNRIRNSRVLCVGAGGLAAEVVKNVVLSGIGHLTLLSPAAVRVQDLGSNFFLREEHEGQNASECSVPGIRLLNPNVDVVSDTRGLDALTPDFLQSFDVVLVTGVGQTEQVRVAELCRAPVSEASKPRKSAFFAAEAMGWYAYHYAQLDSHAFVIKKKSGEDGEETVELKQQTPAWGGEEVKVTKKSYEFPPLREVVELDLASATRCFGRRLKDTSKLYCCIQLVNRFRCSHGRLPSPQDLEAVKLGMGKEACDHISLDMLESLVTCCGANFSPVCAVYGGLLASELLKIISAVDKPWENCMVYNSRISQAACKSIFPNPK